jgi:hypothetical protein
MKPTGAEKQRQHKGGKEGKNNKKPNKKWENTIKI